MVIHCAAAEFGALIQKEKKVRQRLLRPSDIHVPVGRPKKEKKREKSSPVQLKALRHTCRAYWVSMCVFALVSERRWHSRCHEGTVPAGVCCHCATTPVTGTPGTRCKVSSH